MINRQAEPPVNRKEGGAVDLQSLGEFGLIDLINIPAYSPEQVILGRGDDCAVLPFDEKHYQVLSCDLLIEDVHFIRSRITPQQLGYKAVAVNLSDVAAMGGKPVHILLSLALPPDYTVAEWQGFYQGVDEICRRYGVNVIGGDTTSSKDRLAINVTVLGLVEKQHLHLRSHAEPGDAVFVTGSLGGSRAGLELLLDETLHEPLNETLNKTMDISAEHREQLMQCHCRPEPCCEEILVLNRLAGDALHALNDISDGLVSECSEIAAASNISIVLKPEQVPVNESCARLAEYLGADGLQWAMTGGEDYQLVGTMAAEQADKICRRYQAETGKQLTIVGFAEPGSGVYLLQDDQKQPIEQKGYNHFRKPASEKPDEALKAPDGAEHQDDCPLNDMIKKQLADLSALEENFRVYRHDFNNHLACLSGLLQCGETNQAMAYLNQMIAAVPQAVQKTYSSRTILNILLNQKAQQAQRQGMDVEIHCTDGLLDFISDYDLCTLLGNLLDNGIEHSGSREDAYLYLDITEGTAGTEENGQAILIRMENSCEQAPEMHNGVLATQKEEAELHGKGVAQIQRMTARYGGTFSWMYDASQKRFITKCQFLKIS